MFNFQWPENFSIFIDNICIYHVFFDLISFCTIIFTWWFCKSQNAGVHDSSETNEEQVTEESDSSTNVSAETELFEKYEDEYSLVDWNDDNILSNLKIIRQKALAKELQSKLSKDELEEEKKIEKMQLEKIFQLLQDQEEKFQMTSMEQLQDQLHLYRI
ncbi:hypothetical protein RUM43_014728 [Polyplax serrata]|uniref:Matrix-remodeling-associated protein 7 helical domain-containing protein n=1 Tax=Polyplax serrata TaxID=468196 RepID=A0AAN8S2K8_POLSC